MSPDVDLPRYLHQCLQLRITLGLFAMNLIQMIDGQSILHETQLFQLPMGKIYQDAPFESFLHRHQCLLSGIVKHLQMVVSKSFQPIALPCTSFISQKAALVCDLSSRQHREPFLCLYFFSHPILAFWYSEFVISMTPFAIGKSIFEDCQSRIPRHRSLESTSPGRSSDNHSATCRG